ncbi:hypothetical protein [Streptomyces sparsogenes]|uniref:Uncharacterized protein n=1 Tax=Streptomyces sparsogenes DSM 40356 TaxID=1331668 RepID=A0A1R1S4J9_9ACTN|nr:hypothetical protein [Streptomyces sparsogenes]OMI33099.1 hypothetical protein SPAR_43176 [Streptomyces sparsogenes DSM 40356]
MVARRGSSGPDPVALVEIDLYGELMIAASSADGERLSPDRIDEVLQVAADRSDPAKDQDARPQEARSRDSQSPEAQSRDARSPEEESRS